MQRDEISAFSKGRLDRSRSRKGKDKKSPTNRGGRTGQGTHTNRAPFDSDMSDMMS
jgi:hypothetical protein